MTPAERNYGISDKEALVIVKALQHWRHWLEGTKLPVEILTAHKNLEYFTKTRILNRRQLHWLDLLSHYNYHISYQPGDRNGAADALSRRAELAPTDPEEEEPTVMIPRDKFVDIACVVAGLEESEQEDTLIAAIKVMVESDQGIQEQIRVWTCGTQLPEGVQLRDELPYHEDKVYVPDDASIKAQILTLYHDSLMAGHLGQQGTLDLVSRMYWWPGMANYVKVYVKGCRTCGRNKHRNWRTEGKMLPLETPDGPWEWTQSDHITGLPRSQGHDAIYVVSDRLTKMAYFIPTSTRATAEDLVQLHLRHVWKAHGVPRIHNTDRGSTFTADYTQHFFKALGIDQRFSTVYHPQTQGQVESNNKWLETYLRTFCNHRQNDWADLLHTAEFAYNNHLHPSTGMSPFVANYGYDMSLTGAPQPQGADTPLRLALLRRLQARCKEWIEKAQRTQKRAYDLHRSEGDPIVEGSIVWLDARNLSTDRPSPKLDALRHGPFRVSEVMGPLTFRLELPEHWRVSNVFHRSKLHLATEDQIAERIHWETPNVQVTEHEQKVVDEVVDAQWRQGKYELKVWYFGYGPEHNKWVLYEKLPAADRAIEGEEQNPINSYLREHPNAP